MIFRNYVIVSLLSIGAVISSAMPGMTRPATIDIEANLRSGPSMNSSRIDGLPVGTSIEVLKIVNSQERYRGYWYYVKTNGRFQTEGWVSDSLVRFNSSNQTYGTLAGDDDDVINLRSSPRRSSEVLHTGTKGDLVVVGKSKRSEDGYPWYYVIFPNQASGWVRGDLISVWPKGCIITCPVN